MGLEKCFNGVFVLDVGDMLDMLFVNYY